MQNIPKRLPAPPKTHHKFNDDEENSLGVESLRDFDGRWTLLHKKESQIAQVWMHQIPSNGPKKSPPILSMCNLKSKNFLLYVLNPNNI